MDGPGALPATKDRKDGIWPYIKPFLMLLLSVPVLYILSVGPVAWLLVKFHIPKNSTLLVVVGHVYGPLGNISPDSPFGRLYRGYLHLWVNFEDLY
jgi:hypothetical protein